MPFLVNSYTAANGTLLSDHTPDTGDAPDPMDFHLRDGDTTDTITIENNQRWATTNNSQSRIYRYPTDPGGNEYTVTQAWSFHTSGGNRVHGLLARMTPTGTAGADVDYYAASGGNVISTSFGWRLFKNVSGTITVLDFVETSEMFADSWTAKLEVLDAAKTLYINDVSKVTSADNDITQDGRVGEGGGRSSDNQWADDLSAETVGAAFDPANLAVIIDGTTAQLSSDPSPLLA